LDRRKQFGIYTGNEGDKTYLRFVLNRNLNLSNWGMGSNDFKNCPLCDQRGDQNHFLLSCWGFAKHSEKFLDEVLNFARKLLPIKKY
jgi:hypothetical protein